MGSRPSSTYAGTNGTLTNQEATLRTENSQLKEKLQALEKLQPDKIKQENEELKRANKELTAQLETLRESASRRSNTDSTDERHHNPDANKETKEKKKSPRRINSNLVPQRMSDIDAYGQGIPLEKHPPLKIKSHRRRQKKETSDEAGGVNPVQVSVDTEDPLKPKRKEESQGGGHQSVGLSPEKDVDTTMENEMQPLVMDSGQASGCASPLPADDEDKIEKSYQESDLLS